SAGRTIRLRDGTRTGSGTSPRALRPGGPAGNRTGTAGSPDGNLHGSAGQRDQSPGRLHSRPEPETDGPKPAFGSCRGVQGDETLSKQPSSEIPYSGEKPQYHEVKITTTSEKKRKVTVPKETRDLISKLPTIRG
ncbi:hypothetical protein A2U01_0048573, partial [Trifolium medium]|nr:hypothetical protein [Trifolium medium]